MKRILVLLAVLSLFAAASLAAEARRVSEGQRGAETAATEFLEIRSPLEGAVLQGHADDTVVLAWRFLKGPMRSGTVSYEVRDAGTGKVYLSDSNNMREYYWKEWGYYDEFDFSREVSIGELGGPGRNLILAVRYKNKEVTTRFSLREGEPGNAYTLQAPAAVRSAVADACDVMNRLEWRRWIRVWEREKEARRIWHYSVNTQSDETIRFASLLSFQSGRQEADAVDDVEILRVMHFFECDHNFSSSIRYVDETLPTDWRNIDVKFQSVASTEGQPDFRACGWKFSAVVTEMTWGSWLRDEVLLLAQAPYTRQAGFSDSLDYPGEHRVAILISDQDSVRRITKTLTDAGYLALPESVRAKLYEGRDYPGGILRGGGVEGRKMITIHDKGDVMVRNKPKSGAHKIGRAKAGESYPLLEDTGKGWLLIELPDGKKGYITDKLIK